MSEVSYKSLGDAVERLRTALQLLEMHRDDDLYVTVRDSAVMSFQFTYELAAAMLRRFLLTQMAVNAEVKEMTFPTLIRTGSAYGLLLHGWDRWYEYRKARNTISHAYDEERATLAAELAPKFLEDAAYLYKRLMEETDERG